MSSPFDLRARRKYFTRAANTFQRRVVTIARDIDADIAQRGFAGMSCGGHPRVLEALRGVGEVVDEILGFERRAAEFAVKQMRVRGVDDTADVYAEEHERELVAWVKGELGRLPSRILAACHRLKGKPSDLEDLVHAVELEVTERIRRQYHEGRARSELEIEAVRKGSPAGAFPQAPPEGAPPPPPSSQPPDGPLPPNGFAWKGIRHTGLPLKPWRLVRHLWGLPNRACDFEDLAEPVWDDHELPPGLGQVSSARSTVNAFFEKNAIPIRVRIKNRFVHLDQTE